jgi:tetratricopeptide (TPR) repeat protein
MRTRPANRKLLSAFCAVTLAAGCHHAAVRRAADTTPDLPAITADELFRIGLFQAGRGDLLRAEQYLSAARNLGHGGPTVVYWLVRVCVAAGRFQSALRHAAQYLRDDPANWRLRFVVASIHEALGDLEAARIELEEIVKAEPGSPLPHYRLAMLYSRESFGAQHAATHFRTYLALDPTGPHAAEAATLLAHTQHLGRELHEAAPATEPNRSEVIQ